MFNISIFTLCYFTLVITMQVSPLKSFKSVGSKDALDTSSTAFDEGCDSSLRTGYFVKLENFSNVNIEEMLSAAPYSWRLYHCSGN